MSKRTIAIAAVVGVGAITGTATAQSLLSGADIKNNSIKSADIRDGNLRGKDLRDNTLTLGKLSPAARQDLRGPAGEAGPKGETGPKGDTGAPGAPGAPGENGISRVLARSNPAAFDPPSDLTNVTPGGATPILAANLGHVITMQAQVNPTAADWRMDCEIRVGDEVVDRVTSAGASSSDRTQIVGHAVVETTEIELLGVFCGDDGTGTILDDLTLSAVAVDDVV